MLDKDVLRRYQWAYIDDPSAPLLEHVARELEQCRRAWVNGNPAGVIHGLERVAYRNVGYPESLQLVPEWLIEAATEALSTAFKGKAGVRGKGREARHLARWRNDRADLYRAHEVLIARSGQRGEIRDGVLDMSRARKYRGDDAYEEASRRLRQTEAAATPENMKKAFKRFKRRLRTEPWRYVGFGLQLPDEGDS